MKCKSSNLNDIILQDTLIDNIKFNNSSMILYISNISIKNMKILKATITFNDILFKSANFFGYTDKNTNNVIPDLFMDISKIKQDLIKMLKYYPKIYNCAINDDIFTLTILYGCEAVDLSFNFTDFSIEWHSSN